jgi:hypothetical protein
MSSSSNRLVRSTPLELVSALRRHFVRHNLAVLGFTALTLVTAAALWAVLYGFAYWILLFGISAAHGLDAEMPPTFTKVFLLAAAALLSIAWIDRRLHPNERLRDYKSFAAIFGDFLFAIPRVTLAIWGNLSAWQRLSRDELILAATLLQRIAREKRVTLQSAPLDIPNPDTREKIIFALLLSRVLEFGREEGVAWLKLSSSAREELPLRTYRGLE